VTTPRLVLDSPSLIYRAFFALPASIRSPRGESVNAVRGYLDMVSQLIRTVQPRAVIHTFDEDWRPQWRVDAYPGYKSTRRDDPPELPPQFPVIREVLDAAGHPAVGIAAHEADDVIGTLAAQATAEDPIVVVSGDRDLLQLVRDPAVLVLFPVKGVKEMRHYDEAEVEARQGVPASRYADYAILRGDGSDGLPGLRGVGEKSAAQLVRAYPSIEALIDAAEAQTPKLRESIREQADYLRAMQTVVPVVQTLELPPLEHRPPDVPRLEALGVEHAIETPVSRLLDATALLGGTPAR
jgi:5'-3' exonuclease